MATPNMLDYIGQKLDTLDFDGELNLNWDQEARVFEIEFTMAVEAGPDVEVEDQDGETVEEGAAVTYEDAILLYDKTRLDGAEYADNYLTVIGFEGRRGIQQAQVDALFNYLQVLLDDGQSDLFDFADGTSDEDTFVLTFDQAQYDAEYAAQPEAKKHVLLAYPKY